MRFSNFENTLSLFYGMPSLTPIDQATQRREQGDTKSLFAANQSAPSNLASGELCALGRDALGCHCATHVVDSSSGVASEILIEIGWNLIPDAVFQIHNLGEE